MRKTDYTVTGMSCAACSARVEKAVSALEGVSAVSVNLLAGTMRVEGDASCDAVCLAVQRAGYGAAPQEKESRPVPSHTEQIRETHTHLVRFLVSLFLLLPLMYLSMGGMLSLPMPAPLTQNPVLSALAQLLLSGAVLICNNRFFINGVRGLLHRAPNMDTLVSLGSGVSFLYSTALLFRMVYAQGISDHLSVSRLSHGLYFESAAMILVLITLGKMLEARAKGRTTSAIRALLALSPEETTVLREGKELRIPTASVRVGDTVLLRPGERVSVDGVILSGAGAFDESALSGESLPVDKTVGDRVYSASVNLSGALTFRAEGVGEDSALGRIVAAVKEASATKAPIAKLADTVAGIFVPAVMAIACLTFALWWGIGGDLSVAVGHGISVLVISCPCALGLATPVAVMVGSGKGAKHGILFKSAAALEGMGRVRTVLLDKTGTVTEGKPAVTDILPAQGVTSERLLLLAAALEKGSEHPLGRAVVSYAEAQGLSLPAVENFCAHAGAGVSARLDGQLLRGGKAEHLDISLDQAEAVRVAREGKTPLFFSLDGQYLGMIAVADQIKADSAKAVARLKKMGLKTVLVTGDRRDTALAVAAAVGIDTVEAEVSPEGKAALVGGYRAEGGVLMVGDGINDAPALAAADVGVALGAGTDIAIDSASVVLSRASLLSLADALLLSRKTLRSIKQNLFWAFFYNVLAIPLAAGAFVPLFGWHLSPMVGAAAMSISSLTVVSNALRLTRVRLFENTENAENKTRKEGENKGMKITTVTIKGMMCPHCSGRVREALLAIAGVSDADVSHERGNAIVTHSETVSLCTLKEAVMRAGYTVE